MSEHEWGAWIGRSESRTEAIAPDRVAALAATLDLDQAQQPGAPLPPGWHWLFFNPFVRRSELGEDGHPKRGGFLPPVPLPRRMWAGGRVEYLADLPVGATVERRSEIVSIDRKVGKRGELVFVTVRHILATGGADCIREEQDIVYRAPSAPGTPAPPPEAAPGGAIASEEVHPDPVLLFRYSALTSNGHRIHYDLPYAREEEGYPGLVVHGPLTATLLQGFARRCCGDARLARFAFRGVSPLFAGHPFRLEAAAEEEGLQLWARGPEGELAMGAEATFRT
ncbi:acyl-CoA dehydrogenase [Roseomonas eburnea]|uniref:Acyl-CoA dehydrogenase n=1 Tax=Neoroseomonas eburnea TaxID=1346889 RepID=A0A9X9XB37_9PROT|nr:MaoC family dehydratase N-terminal domain-containing protein [Neoroseomonas eburnea]MBR0680923.1 acyl-CoA dehydrogenase [Neoroseomonas eburnea]